MDKKRIEIRATASNLARRIVIDADPTDGLAILLCDEADPENPVCLWQEETEDVEAREDAPAVEVLYV